jgi:hypothetical protein
MARNFFGREIPDPEAPAAPADAAPKPPSLEQQMTDEANRMAAQEFGRQEESIRTAEHQFGETKSELANLVDPALMFSLRSDQIGARSKRALSNLRTSLSGRGVGAHSGAARGSLERLALGIENAAVSGRRDVELANQRTRMVNAATNFANAVNLSQIQAQPVSGIQYENLQNLFEGQIAREGIHAMASAQRAASKDRKAGSLGGGVLGLAGSAVTGGK